VTVLSRPWGEKSTMECELLVDNCIHKKLYFTSIHPMVITNLVVFRQTGDSHKLDLFFCLSNIGPNPTATRPTVDWRYKMVISCN